MIVSQKKYNQVNQLFIVLIACIIVFRNICTPILIIYFLFNFWHYKYINVEKKHINDIILISTPFFINLFFFFTNDSFSGITKSVEKVLTLAIFPLLILTNPNFNIKFILDKYRIWFSIILFLTLLRFILIYPEKIIKYLNGIDLIEVGYQYAISLGTHAPALNMHVAFLTVVNFYFLINGLISRISKSIVKNIVLFLLSFILILIINTRLALLNVVVCLLVVLVRELSQRFSLKKIVIALIFGLIFLVTTLGLYVKINPYMKEKYSSATFAHIDKVGKLDEIKSPEKVVFNALVTRVSIWKSASELALDNLVIGVGASDSKNELNHYFEKTNQHFLAKYKFPVHNQFLDYTIKFGILGFVVCTLYLFYPFYKQKSLPKYSTLFICFGIIFFTSNLVDDFLLRFDGIVFSGLFYTLFSSISYTKNETR